MAIVASDASSVPSPSLPPRRWQDALKVAVRDPLRLCQLLQLPDPYHEGALQAANRFPVFVPLEFLQRMRPGDPNDPLVRQVLPTAEELESQPGDAPDPVDDRSAAVCPGLLRKYAGRALLITTGACAVHCRFCFRRHFDYEQSPRSWDAWQPAFDHLVQDTTLREVLLSGGDPLMLPDHQIEALLARLASMAHLRRVRIHTRLPIVIPQRVTAALVSLLGSQRLRVIVVVHTNHPVELDPQVCQGMGRLLDAGIPVLNQSVLMRGVNDCCHTLVELSERLLDERILPYYLHQFDPVLGAAHFRVPVERGLRLIEQMRSRLPGYAVPRYVRELPGRASKTLLA